MKTVYFSILLLFLLVLFFGHQYLRYIEERNSGFTNITHENPKLSSAFIEQNPWKPECEDGYKIAYSLNLKYDEKKKDFVNGPLESVWCVME